MKLIKVLLLSLSVCALARAQAPAAAPAPSPAAVPAQVQKPTTESIEKLLQVMKVQQMLSPVVKQMHGMIDRMTGDPRISGTMTGAEKAELAKVTDKEFEVIDQFFTWDNLKELYVSIYQDTFTQKEVDALTAFYETPEGASIVTKLPTAMQASMIKMQAKIIPMMQKMMTEVRQEAQQIKEADAAAAAAAAATPAPAPAPKPAGS